MHRWRPIQDGRLTGPVHEVVQRGRVCRLLFADEGTLAERMDDVEKEFEDNPIVKEIVAFIRAGGKRGICMPHAEA